MGTIQVAVAQKDMTHPPHPFTPNLQRASFFVTVAILIGVIVFHLATPFITILFGYLTLYYLGKVMPKRVAILCFSILFIVLVYLSGHFITEAARALPMAANKAIPLMVDYLNKFANKFHLTLPFTDAETMKAFLLQKIHLHQTSAFKYAGIFTKEFVYVIIGVVATCAIFMNGKIDLGVGTYPISNNLYSEFTAALGQRFRFFFQSFHRVMGAQVVISIVNTFFTGIFLGCLMLFDCPLPYSFVIVVVTFLCGLLPIVGNLISNTVIFAIGITQSLQLAVISLLYLIVLHKFEYFLNSRIIGGRIKNPMWLTLLALLIGERVAGIPGMILAPVILNYLKIEGTQIHAAPAA